MNTPTTAQRQAKQKFWRKINANGGNSDPSKLTHVQVARLAGDFNVSVHLSDPEYHEWFFNEKSDDDLLKAGAEGAIRRLISIIESDAEEVKPAVQVAASKILLEMAGHGGKAKEVVYKDQEIAAMSEEELRAFIQQQTERVN